MFPKVGIINYYSFMIKEAAKCCKRKRKYISFSKGCAIFNIYIFDSDLV